MAPSVFAPELIVGDADFDGTTEAGSFHRMLT
jgi:hypothetical protein